MAIVYVNDDGSNTSPFDTLAKAATTLATGVAQLAAGDDLFIGMDHAEDPGTVTYTFPGTKTNPNRVISINTTTEDYDKADNPQINQAIAGDDITINGSVQMYGVSIINSDNFIMNGVGEVLLFDDCLIELSSVSAQFNMGNNTPISVTLKNTILNFSAGGASTTILQSNSYFFKMLGGEIQWTGTQPTNLFAMLTSRFALVNLAGVNLTAITSALFDTAGAYSRIEMHHCLLDSGVNIFNGSIDNPIQEVWSTGSDDTTGNNLYRLDFESLFGTVVHDDATFRVGGTSDGTTPISWKMVSNANATEFSEPLSSPPIFAFLDSTGSKTFTISILRDSVTDLQDDEIWIEVEFLESATDTDSDFVDDAPVDVLATPVDQANNTESWTISPSMTNENKQEVAVTATVNRVGPFIARVYLAKPSTTVFIDPKVEVT